MKKQTVLQKLEDLGRNFYDEIVAEIAKDADITLFSEGAVEASWNGDTLCQRSLRSLIRERIRDSAPSSFAGKASISDDAQADEFLAAEFEHCAVMLRRNARKLRRKLQ